MKIPETLQEKKEFFENNYEMLHKCFISGLKEYFGNLIDIKDVDEWLNNS